MIDDTEDDKIKKENRDMLNAIKDKSEDDFEKNLVLITSGTLVLSMTFIDKIAPLAGAKGVWWLISAWFLLIASLLLNLMSHQKASKYSMVYIYECAKGTSEEDINILIKKNNRTMTRINNWTVRLLILGIAFLVVYCSINAYRMSKIPDSKKDEAAKDLKDKVWINKYGRQTALLVVSKPTVPVDNPPADTDKKQ